MPAAAVNSQVEIVISVAVNGGQLGVLFGDGHGTGGHHRPRSRAGLAVLQVDDSRPCR
jgi:hypothetical protein